MAKQCVFGLFHINKEVREVNDARGIGVTEFHSPLGFEDF